MKVKELIKVLQAFDKDDYDVVYPEFDDMNDFRGLYNISTVGIRHEEQQIVISDINSL